MPLVTESLDFIASLNEPLLEVAQILPNSSSFTSSVPSTCETVMTSIRRKMKKSVHFRTVTVYYFPRMQGYSSIPSQDGPTLGMSNKHVLVETYDLMNISEHRTNNLHVRVEHLRQKEGGTRPSAFADSVQQDSISTLPQFTIDPLSNDELCCVCVPAEQKKLVGSTMQPVTLRQRKKLLREAGVSKIDAVEEAEAREIRISRTLCGCSCKVVCRPDTCLCSRSEIPCQVDSGSFPCPCSEFSCGNPAGRLQFDVAQVMKQRVLRLAQLQVESSLDDRGRPAMGLVKVELLISPTKRTKSSKAASNTRKRVAPKKRPFRKELRNQSSAMASEKLEMERLLECEEELEKRYKENEREMVRHEHLFNGRDEKDVLLENKVSSSGEKTLTVYELEFREPAQESPNEAGLTLESVDAALDMLQNEPNASYAEDMSFSDETNSCTRGFDLDPENDLDPNCLKALVIENKNLEGVTSDTCLGVVSNSQSRSDLGVKYLQSTNDLQMQNNLEFEPNHGFIVDPKNDLQPAVDIDLELKCEVVESNRSLQSADDLDLDLQCDVSLNCRSLQPTYDLDTESKSDCGEDNDIRNSEVVQTNELDLGAVSNDLHNTFVVDSSVLCSHRSNEQSISCGSLISRFSSNHLGKTGDSDLASHGLAESQGHVEHERHRIVSEGHFVESQGHIVYEHHCIESEGHYIESQGHCVERQSQSIESQSHCMESQGDCMEPQGHWNVLNGDQMAAKDLKDNSAFALDGELCNIAAESKVEDFHYRGSPLEVVTLQEASSTQSSTLKEVSDTSKDSNEWQRSENCDVCNNLEDDLTDDVCAGSTLEASAVLN